MYKFKSEKNVISHRPARNKADCSSEINRGSTCLSLLARVLEHILYYTLHNEIGRRYLNRFRTFLFWDKNNGHIINIFQEFIVLKPRLTSFHYILSYHMPKLLEESRIHTIGTRSFIGMYVKNNLLNFLLVQ